MIRRRRTVRTAREAWLSGRTGPLARAGNSQAGMALLLPRAGRAIELLGLGPGRRYLDIGCGTRAYADLLANRAGLDIPPISFDITPAQPPIDVLGWPEHLPFPDASFDAVTCFHFLRRFDDDVVHGFAGELARILAPGGAALVTEFAPVKNAALDRLHRRIVSPGCAEVDLRGWGRLAALFTECGFGSIDLVDLGPYAFPPIPRVSVLLRQSADEAP